MAQLQSQAEARRKLMSAARQAKPARARNGRTLPPALFLTDPKRTKHPERIVAKLPPGWGVVYRHFGAKDRETVARELSRICKRRKLVLLISADPMLARAVKADGVHWPEARLSQKRALGMIETASAHSRVGLACAQRAGVDAIILSAIFAGASKSAPPAIGALRFRQLVRGKPVYALGGINASNAARTGSRFAAIDGILVAWNGH